MARKTSQAGGPVPADQYSEAQAVGIALNEPSVVESGEILPEHFYNSHYGAVFRAILEWVHAGKMKDNPAGLNDKEISLASGVELSEIDKLRSSASTTDKYTGYAQIIKDLSNRRKLIALFNRASNEFSDLKRPVADIITNSLSHLSGFASAALNGATPKMVVLESATISVSNEPSYKVRMRMGTDIREVVFTSEELTSRDTFKRKVMDKFLLNPILPERSEWDSFIDEILDNATHELAPEETSREAALAFYIREWRKLAIPADNPNDLMRGYVERDGFVFFLPERLRSWIVQASRGHLTNHQLWLNVQQWGGCKRMVRVGSAREAVRRMWGLPRQFFEQEYIETADEIDLSFLDE